jgi:hypothetical protein
MSDSSRLPDASTDTASPVLLPIRRCSTARAYGIEAVETVTMTAEQYEEAVNALAALIVNWAQDQKQGHRPTGRHANSD